MTQTVPDRKTKRADELKPGDAIADDLYDEPHPVLGAHRFIDCGAEAVLVVLRSSDGTVYSREFDAAAIVPVESAPELTGYQATAAELRRIAAGLDTLPPGDMPLAVQMYAFPPTKTVEAVDAVALAVLGRLGETKRDGVKWRHGATGPMLNPSGVYFSIGAEVPGPADERDAELERLRAKVAELEGLTFSREDDDPQVIRPHSPRPPAHIGDAESHISADGRREDYETPQPTATRPLISDETIAEAAAMEERDRLAGGPPWEVPGHPDHALPGGWHRGQIR